MGARGAVGAAVTAEVRDLGHDPIQVGRTSVPGGIAADATSSEGLKRIGAAARDVDAVIDASGLERLDLQRAIGTTPLIDISATASHLTRLAAAAPAGSTVLLGAGIAPGASSVLIAALDVAPGDDIDVAVLLGAGEAHGAAAVEWTARLAGTTVFAAPETDAVGGKIRNLRTTRRFPDGGRDRRFLRADFPDDALIGRPRGLRVRSWLALDSALATNALALVGLVPPLAPMLRHAPHLGSDRWRVRVSNRRTGHTRLASGRGQSVATGRLAARAALRIAEGGVTGVVTMADVLTPADLVSVDGIEIDEDR
ncbi:MAG: hypothetical protein J0I43_11670 [Microbacterium sp.]|nr:hypothetical protein [Microbacterium sp.]